MRTKKKDEYEEGPFSQALGKIAIARVLDQSLFIGKLEFTVSILAEATGLTYHTIKSCLKHLQSINWVTPTRTLGNAQAYKFNVENHMSGIVNWAYDYQRSQLEVAE
jgi:DNA-binding transcriptional regulator GbsR (MarR family)